MKTKAYKAKSSVRRAAKGMEGFDLENLQVLQNEAGEWYGTDEVEENLDKPCHAEMDYTDADEAVPAEDIEFIDAYGTATCPHCSVHLSNGVTDNVLELEGIEAGHRSFVSAQDQEEVESILRASKHQYTCLGCCEDFGPAVDLTKKEAKKIEKINKSTTSKPCSLVWEICEQMKGAKRKEVLAACVEQGVAYYTARTQYQQWLVASRGETK